jgi:hypothetical protein
MPRQMPALGGTFGRAVDAAVAIAEAGELVRASAAAGSVARRELRQSRLEALHEMAYLRIFIAWEAFLEATFLRMMCGYDSNTYTPAFAAGQGRQATLAHARLAMLDGRQYVLWHNPKHVRKRSAGWFIAGPHEVVIDSNLTRLEWFAAVRHRIAHGTEDTRASIDTATINLGGRRYPGSSAGRFLRDWDTSSSPPSRWLSSIGHELRNVALQIAP